MARRTTQSIKTRQNKRTRRLKKLPSLGQAILLLVAGLLMGTVFTVLIDYTQEPVTMKEARPVSAVMEDVRGSYTRRYRQGIRLQQILILFEDYEQLSIDSVIATEALLNRLSGYAPGTTFDMLVHPNSATILELRIDGKEIVSFDDAVAKLSGENKAFFWMGVCLYAAAAFGAYVVILRLKLRRY